MCFGPHVDEASAAAARDAGADVVLPRSKFFRDPAAAIAGGALVEQVGLLSRVIMSQSGWNEK